MISRDSHRLLALAAALVLTPLLASCAGGPSGDGLAPTEGQMIGHYGQFAEIQSSLFMGELLAAQSAAQTLESRPMPPTTTDWVSRVQSSARELWRASSLEAAALASGRIAMSCGGCHAAVGAEPQLRISPGAPAGNTPQEHMLRAEWAVDHLADGLIGNSNDVWMRGAEVLQNEDEMASLGELAAAAQGEQRAEVYGQVLAACADCHTR